MLRKGIKSGILGELDAQLGSSGSGIRYREIVRLPLVLNGSIVAVWGLIKVVQVLGCSFSKESLSPKVACS